MKTIVKRPAAQKQPSMRLAASKTRSHRIQFTPIESETVEILHEIAKKYHSSVSTVVAQLVEEALDARENEYFSQKLKKRLAEPHTYVKYEDVRQQFLRG